MNIAEKLQAALGKNGCDLSRDKQSVLIPGPGHGKDDRSLSVKNDPNNPEGFVVFSHASDDPTACRDLVLPIRHLFLIAIRRDARCMAEAATLKK